MRGIVSWGTHVPYRRVDRSTIAAFVGTGGGAGSRAAASYDEDATTMAVAAGRAALRATSLAPDDLWFTTTAPPYLDKTNATAVHAALRLPRSTPAFDALGAVRSSMGCLRTAMRGPGLTLVASGDLRTGLAGGPEESTGGDAGAALLVGEADPGEVVAELVGSGSATAEFTDRWRPPAEPTSKLWEERFGETRYLELGLEASHVALDVAGLAAQDIDRLIVTSSHGRAARALTRKLGVDPSRVVDDLSASVGFTGAASPALLLAATLEGTPGSGAVVGLVSLADGADVMLFRTTPSLAGRRQAVPVTDQIAAHSLVPYGQYLAWRGLLAVEPPRRPGPARPSSSAAARATDWKFGFVGSIDDQGMIRLPPDPWDEVARPMADAIGTVVTYTVDRLAYSPSPPIVFAVVDFEGGGRVPIELTDVDPDEVGIGMRVELAFRKLFTADGIHNYFWKGRPARGGAR